MANNVQSLEFYTILIHLLLAALIDALNVAQTACELASQTLGIEKVANSSNAEYNEDVQFNWSETCWLQPQCIIKVSSASDVASTMEVIGQYGVRFAVRSGGHNPNAGFASVDDSGILLDLSALKNFSISADRTVVTVGAGTIWGEVYNELDTYNLSVVGAKEPYPGVGGSILGGGDPFFPNIHGMACDNVKSFEVVLSNGSVVETSAAQNNDLFKGLKGGGPNLGIITSVDLYTRPPLNTWSNFVMYDSSQNMALLQAYEAFQHEAEQEERSNIIFNLAGNITVVGFLFADHVATLPSVFSSFSVLPQLGIASPATNTTLAGLANILGDLTPVMPARRAIYGVSSTISQETYQQALASYDSALTSLASIESNASLLLTLQPFGSKAVYQGVKNGGNLLGISPVAQTWYALQATYSLASSDSTIETINSQLAASIRNSSAGYGAELPFLFLNDLSAQQNPFAGYGIANQATLEAASMKYDPERIFQKLQNSGFLINKYVSGA